MSDETPGPSVGPEGERPTLTDSYRFLSQIAQFHHRRAVDAFMSLRDIFDPNYDAALQYINQEMAKAEEIYLVAAATILPSGAESIKELGLDRIIGVEADALVRTFELFRKTERTPEEEQELQELMQKINPPKPSQEEYQK